MNQDGRHARERGEIIRAAYADLRRGDVPALLDLIAEDVAIDRPALRLWGEVQHGRDYFAHVIGRMVACADIRITGSRIFEGESDVAATLAYTLTARNSGETLTVEIVELFRFAGGRIARIDVYGKDPARVAGFFARAEGDRGQTPR